MNRRWARKIWSDFVPSHAKDFDFMAIDIERVAKTPRMPSNNRLRRPSGGLVESTVVIAQA